MTAVLAFSICKESGRMAGRVLCEWVERKVYDSGFPCKLISLDILHSVYSYMSATLRRPYIVTIDLAKSVLLGVYTFDYTSSLVKHAKMI
jgi:hypothetical protein